MPRVQAGEVVLSYEESGAGPPVLLLHGLGSSAADWEHQLPVLAAHHRVIAVDLRGHGRSEKPEGGYSIGQFARDVVALMDQLGIARAHLIGLSMGAMVGFQLAVDAPARVASLVAINAAPELVPRSLREWLQLRLRLALVGLLDLGTVAKLIARRLFPKPGQRALRERFVAKWVQNDPVAYRKATRMLPGWSVVDRLAAVRCPVLMVAADGDYTPVAAKERYLTRLPTARLAVVNDSRHATPYDQPERLNALLVEALAREAP